MFYINTEGESACFAKAVKRVCRLLGYKFVPNNKPYYLVDTVMRTCTGVDGMVGGHKIYSGASSWKELKNLFTH